MRARILILLTAGFCLAVPPVGHADEVTWQRALNAGEAAYRGGDYTEAAFAFGLALKAAESFGESDIRLSTSLGWLAETYRLQGRLAEAEPLIKRALAIRERVLGPVHPSTHLTRHNLAALQKAIAASPPPSVAAPLAWRVEVAPSKEPARAAEVAVLRPKETESPPAPPIRVEAPKPAPPARVVEPEPKPTPPAPVIVAKPKPQPPSPRVEMVEAKPSAPPPPALKLELAELKSRPAEPKREPVEPKPKPQPPAIQLAPPKPVAAPPPVAAVVAKPAPPQASYRSGPAQQLALLRADARGGADSQAPKAFEMMQRARSRSEAGNARIAVRLAPGDDAVARAARERRSLFERLGELDRSLADGGDIERRIAEQDAVIERAIPSYRVHLNPQPLPLGAAQALLGPDEALLSYFVDDQLSYLVAARRDRAAFFPLGIGRAELAAAVKRLRSHLDPAGDVVARGVPPPFPTDLAHRLYAVMVAPASQILEGAAHVLIVADDSLHSLPFAVLVTEPFTARPKEEQARPAWLAKRHALTSIPSEASLQALRRNATAAAGSRSFTGFGNPLLLGDDRRVTPAGAARLFGAGDAADVNLIRDLVPIPETRYVLDAMSDILNGDPRDVHVESNASESRVKGAPLSDFRVLAFATYGLMAGDFPGSAEPGLVFTPPRFGSAQDDGLLTASEVAQLKLDADLVVLPSASTAAADGTPSAEGLPRLARAFLHAGSRSLLVSHWNVSSDSTLKLVSRMLRERARGAGNAEALRRSMLALMNGEDRPAYTHPMYWAALVVVGEGARSTTSGSPILAAPATGR